MGLDPCTASGSEEGSVVLDQVNTKVIVDHINMTLLMHGFCDLQYQRMEISYCTVLVSLMLVCCQSVYLFDLKLPPESEGVLSEHFLSFVCVQAHLSRFEWLDQLQCETMVTLCVHMCV